MKKSWWLITIFFGVAFLSIFIRENYTKRLISKFTIQNDRGGYLDNTGYNVNLSKFEIYNIKECDICFVGDSLTERCLWNEIYPDLQIANRGIGSDVSEGVLNRPDNIIELNPKIIVLMIGINDIGKNIPPSDTVKNFEKIVEKFNMELPYAKVFIFSLLPANPVELKKIMEMNYKYSKIAEQKENVVFIDVYDLFLDDGSLKIELYDPDGVHLKGEGYLILKKNLDNYITEFF